MKPTTKVVQKVGSTNGADCEPGVGLGLGPGAVEPEVGAEVSGGVGPGVGMGGRVGPGAEVGGSVGPTVVVVPGFVGRVDPGIRGSGGSGGCCGGWGGWSAGSGGGSFGFFSVTLHVFIS